MSPELLIDNSAWSRLWDEALPDSRADEISDDLDAGRIAVCLPFLLEAGYSARDAEDHEELRESLISFPLVGIDEVVERRALDVQGQLASVGHHRMPPADIFLAAIAERHALGVLHYDQDFEILLAKTDLDFFSAWLMPRGSL